MLRRTTSRKRGNDCPVPPSAKHYTTALIAAAGMSTRMTDEFGNPCAKQQLQVMGIPVLARTLLAYEAAETVSEIILITRREDFDAFIAMAREYHITKLRRVTEGGETRQDSVRRGLSVVSEATRYVAIADGARCLITPDQIDAVNRAAYRTDAAIAATPAVDSIKIADRKNRTTASPDRATIWQAQTPQTFAIDLYRAAAYYAKDHGIQATDDSALVEAIGRHVALVDCGRENIKITARADLYLARAILQYRATAAEKN